MDKSLNPFDRENTWPKMADTYGETIENFMRMISLIWES